MKYPGEQGAYHALCGVLYTHQLATHLPLLVRSLYFGGYRPTGKPDKMRRADVVARVAAELQLAGGGDPEGAIYAVLRVLDRHVDPGAFDQVWHLMPSDLRDLWPT